MTCIVDILQSMKLPLTRWIGLIRCAVENGAVRMAEELTMRYSANRPGNFTFLNRIIHELDMIGGQLDSVRAVLRAFFSCMYQREGLNWLEVMRRHLKDNNSSRFKFFSEFVTLGFTTRKNTLSWSTLTSMFELLPEVFHALSTLWVERAAKVTYEDVGDGRLRFLVENGLVRAQDVNRIALVEALENALISDLGDDGDVNKYANLNMYDRDELLSYLVRHFDHTSSIMDTRIVPTPFHRHCCPPSAALGSSSAAQQDQDGTTTARAISLTLTAVKTDCPARDETGVDAVNASENSAERKEGFFRAMLDEPSLVNDILCDRSGMGSTGHAINEKAIHLMNEAKSQNLQWCYEFMRQHYIATVCGPVSDDEAKRELSMPASPAITLVNEVTECMSASCLQWLVNAYAEDPRFIRAETALLPNIIRADRADLLHIVLEVMAPSHTSPLSSSVPWVDGSAQPLLSCEVRERRAEIVKSALEKEMDRFIAYDARNIYSYAFKVLQLKTPNVSPLLFAGNVDAVDFRKVLLDYVDYRLRDPLHPSEREIWERYAVAVKETAANTAELSAHHDAFPLPIAHTAVNMTMQLLPPPSESPAASFPSSLSPSPSLSTSTSSLLFSPFTSKAAASVLSSELPLPTPLNPLFPPLPYISEADAYAIEYHPRALWYGLQTGLLSVDKHVNNIVLSRSIKAAIAGSGDLLDRQVAQVIHRFTTMNALEGLYTSQHSLHVSQELLRTKAVDFGCLQPSRSPGYLILCPSHLPLLQEWMHSMLANMKPLSIDDTTNAATRTLSQRNILQVLSVATATMLVASMYPIRKPLLAALDVCLAHMHHLDPDAQGAVLHRIVQISLHTRSAPLVREIIQQLKLKATSPIFSDTWWSVMLSNITSCIYFRFPRVARASGATKFDLEAAVHAYWRTYFKSRVGKTITRLFRDSVWGAMQLAYASTDATIPALWCICAMAEDHSNAADVLRIVDLLSLLLQGDRIDVVDAQLALVNVPDKLFVSLQHMCKHAVPLYTKFDDI